MNNIRATKKERGIVVGTAGDELYNRLSENDTIYTNIAHVSQSGMQRAIVFYIVENGKVMNISPLVAGILDCKVDRKHQTGGIIVKGAGMDMAYHVVYQLSRAIFGDGYALDKQDL